MASHKTLPPMMRHITTHDANGKAVWDTSFPLEPKTNHVGGFNTQTAFVNEHEPYDCNDDRDLDSYRDNMVEKELYPSSGSVVRVLDILPGWPPLLHRTRSLDYGVVMDGEVECILDDGALRVFKKGDIVIQRGTNHAWRALNNEPARIVFIILPITPIKINGEEIEVVGYAGLAKVAEEAGGPVQD